MLRRERESRRSRYIGILIFVAVGIAIGLWHNRMTAHGRSDILTGAVRTVTVPVVSAVSGVGRWIGGQFGWLFRGRAISAQNARLLAENAQLREENARLHEADITAQRLRQQLGFAEMRPPDKFAADVIALRPNPNFETLVIGRGSRDGVHLNSVVISPYGLVGHVYDVAPTSASVLLLTDSNSAVGAMVQRSRVVGVCKGDGSRLFSLDYLDRAADVKVGDTIISSGLGGGKGIYPKGQVLGTVMAVADDVSGATRRVTVKPSVDFNRLEEVYVIR